ncbi:MAG TPA: alpha/beta fold hydrolase, partial [Solirubrobacter sp.]|nr:alpha/beta fold hydrolase [Solirubrobacter sp.]
VPIARRVARAGRGRLAVFRLLNSRRGWDSSHTPVHDARWALDEIAERLGARPPTCLLGHSLGGRAALLAAGAPGVRSAVALAPWVYPTDIPPGLDGRRILIVHGTEDRVADPDRSAALARALDGGVRLTYVTVEGGKHAMLGRRALFDGLAADFAAATLLDTPLPEPLDGRRWITL